MFDRYTEDDLLLDLCTFLDPRVKTAPYLDSDRQEALRSRVLRCMQTLSRSHTSSKPTATQAATDRDSSTDQATNNKSDSTLGGLLGDMFPCPSTSTSTNDDQEREESEIRQYKNDSLCSMDASPLSW